MARKKADSIILSVGTRKGAFVFTSKDGRRTWKSSGPFFRGKEIYHVTYDKRNKILFASVNDEHWGPSVARSTDLGKNWKITDPPKYPKESGLSVKRIWNVTPGTENEENVVYAGVEPAMLFRSDNRGESWSINESLLNNETRPKWQPGGGGLCLHTILVDERDPNNMHLAISAVGTLNSKDGGSSWKFQNKNVLADFFPEKYPEYGQCVHKIVRNRERPDVLYQQNHCGVYRSDDNGENWIDIRNNLPSRFGFPIAVDANDPKRVYTAPLEGDFSRVSPDNKFSIWVSDNSGKHWHSLSKGFPKPAYFEVLRDSMKTDEEDPCGVYVGTKTGQLYASKNHGNNWTLVSGILPEILSVSVSSSA
jgi:hypothetical protein